MGVWGGREKERAGQPWRETKTQDTFWKHKESVGTKGQHDQPEEKLTEVNRKNSKGENLPHVKEQAGEWRKAIKHQ